MKKSSRVINLTSSDDFHTDEVLQEIPMLDNINVFLRRLLAKLNNSNTLDSLNTGLQTLIKAEDSLTLENITLNDVAIIINPEECDSKAIMSMNTSFYTFDINKVEQLENFNDIKQYATSLTFPDYEFFNLAFKCLCTVNTRIGTHLSCPAILSDWDYNEQDFLELLKIITKDKCFTLEIDGIPNDVTCDRDGWVKVDGKKITSYSELGSNFHTVIIAMYQNHEMFKVH